MGNAEVIKIKTKMENNSVDRNRDGGEDGSNNRKSSHDGEAESKSSGHKKGHGTVQKYEEISIIDSAASGEIMSVVGETTTKMKRKFCIMEQNTKRMKQKQENAAKESLLLSPVEELAADITAKHSSSPLSRLLLELQQQQEKILQQQQKKLRGNNNKNINNEQPHQHNYPPLTTDVERAKYLLEASTGNVDLALALYWDDHVAHHVQAQQQGQNQGGNQGGSIDEDLNIKKDNRIMKVNEMKRKKKEEKVDFIKTRNDVYENDNDSKAPTKKENLKKENGKRIAEATTTVE